MNNHIYSLAFTKIILDLILKSTLFDFNTPHIFCLDTVEEVPFQELKKIIEEIILDNSDISALEEKINTYNKTNSDPINSHILARLCKDTIQNGRILPLNNLEVHTAWLILLSEIKKIYTPELIADMTQAKKEKKSYLLPGSVYNNFLNFLGELCNRDLPYVAAILHNYLYLGHIVTQNQQNNLMCESYVAQMMSSSFINVLELSGKIMFQNNIINDWEKGRHLNQEFLFIGYFISQALQDPAFSKVFDPENYKPFCQPKGIFHTTQANLYQKIWDTPDITLVPHFSEKKINTPVEKKRTIKKSNSITSFLDKDKDKDKTDKKDKKYKDKNDEIKRTFHNEPQKICSNNLLEFNIKEISDPINNIQKELVNLTIEEITLDKTEIVLFSESYKAQRNDKLKNNTNNIPEKTTYDFK